MFKEIADKYGLEGTEDSDMGRYGSVTITPSIWMWVILACLYFFPKRTCFFIRGSVIGREQYCNCLSKVFRELPSSSLL